MKTKSDFMCIWFNFFIYNNQFWNQPFFFFLLFFFGGGGIFNFCLLLKILISVLECTKKIKVCFLFYILGSFSTKTCKKYIKNKYKLYIWIKRTKKL